jgi:uncharacterized protein YdaU (DUF1376 family)
MHYYKFNIGDYASHTRHLSPIEDLAYRRLLDIAYTTEKPIPNDLREISRIINLREYQQEITDVLKEFWHLVDGEGWINNRVLKEIELTGEKSDKAAQSAKVRWDAIKNAKAMRQRCEGNTNASKSDANASKSDATHYPLPITQDPLPKIKNISALALLIELEVPEQIAKDWLAVRKAKRAPLTQTALNDLKIEAGKAGISIVDAITICAKKNWQGFNSTWDWRGNGQKTPKQDNFADKNYGEGITAL